MQCASGTRWQQNNKFVLFHVLILPKTQMNLQDVPLDLLEVYWDLSFTLEPRSPFCCLAAHLLSVCANSATCECLFIVFRNTLMKLRNQMGVLTLSSIAELKMHICDEHHLKSMKTQMKHMFATCSTTFPDEPSALSTDAQPLSPQPESLEINEDDTSSINKDPDHVPGFCDFIPNYCSVPTKNDELVTYSSLRGKLNLSQLFNFENPHWVKLYDKCAKRSYEEELVLYNLLNEDAGTGDGMEVDIDEATADILIGWLYIYSFCVMLNGRTESPSLHHMGTVGCPAIFPCSWSTHWLDKWLESWHKVSGIMPVNDMLVTGTTLVCMGHSD